MQRPRLQPAARLTRLLTHRLPRAPMPLAERNIRLHRPPLQTRRTQKWRNVLQSGRRWGSVSITCTGRGGGAPPPPPPRPKQDQVQWMAFRGQFDYSLDAKNRLNVS